jgi:hypothetical protein
MSLPSVHTVQRLYSTVQLLYTAAVHGVERQFNYTVCLRRRVAAPRRRAWPPPHLIVQAYSIFAALPPRGT